MALQIQAHNAHTTEKRPTIALLLTECTSWWAGYLLTGVTDAAEAFDVNLFCYIGDRWHEKRAGVNNGIYELLDPALLDGIIVSGNITYGLTPAALDAFVSDLTASFAVVGLVMEHEKIPSIIVDGFQGMYHALKHLIEVHGRRRIVFIRGPVGNFDADERYRAYTTILAEYGIPLNPDWVLNGDFNMAITERALRQFLPSMMAGEAEDVVRRQPWAIAAANDDMARAVMAVLEEYQLSVPQDVAVIGFDDSEAGRYLEVPLTSVRQPIYTMGYRAVELLVRRLRGEAVSVHERVPAELVVRQSCGCRLSALYETDTLAPPVSEDTEEDIPPFTKIPAPVWEAFIAELKSPDLSATPQHFLSVLEQTLYQLRIEGVSLENWNTLISALRRHVLIYVAGTPLQRRAEDLLQEARLLVGEYIRREEVHQRLLLVQQDTAINALELTLSTALRLQDLGAALTGTFTAVGIESCYVTLYEGEASLTPDGQSRLFLAYDRGRGEQGMEFYADGLLFPSRRLIPETYLAATSRWTYMILPLGLQQQRLGFIAMWGGRRWQLYARLAQRLSEVLYRALLLGEQEHAQLEAQEAKSKAEMALRDALAAQRRYIRGAWQERAETIAGYVHSPTSRGVTEEAWLPAMSEAVRQMDVVVTQDEDGGQSLALPLTLYGQEMIGVLGLKTADATPWTERQITLARTIATEMALALETQRLLADSQRRASRLLAAAEVSRVTTSILTLDELLPQAVNLIRERFGLYYVGIFLVDDSRRWAVLRAGTGEAGRIMLERNHRLEVGGVSMIGSCVAQGEARIASDTRRETIYRPNPLLPDTRSELALPLITRGTVIGAMTVQDTQPGAFLPEDITILQTMADQLANAIENARLLRRMEQSMQELERASNRLTQESWRNFLESYRQTLGYRYRLSDVEPTDELSPEARAALERQAPVVTTVAAETEEGRVQAALSVPLRVRNQVVGVVNLRFEDPVISPETVSLVEQIAVRLGTALENARLLEESRRAALREQIEARIGARLRERMDIDYVLQTAVREMVSALHLTKVEVRLGTGGAATPVPEEVGV